MTSLEPLAQRLGLSAESEALAVALTHSSYAAEHGCDSNERLEFLGDAVVDLAVADLIVTLYPQLNEGTGSLVRSRVVNESSLARAARRLELAPAIRLARGVARAEAAGDPGEVDPKTRVRQWADANDLGEPTYEVTGEGPAHATTFEATVLIGGRAFGVGRGPSKKAAEAAAARAAYQAGARA